MFRGRTNVNTRINTTTNVVKCQTSSDLICWQRTCCEQSHVKRNTNFENRTLVEHWFDNVVTITDFSAPTLCRVRKVSVSLREKLFLSWSLQLPLFERFPKILKSTTTAVTVFCYYYYFFFFLRKSLSDLIISWPLLAAKTRWFSTPPANSPGMFFFFFLL